MFEPSFISTPTISPQSPSHSKLGIASLAIGILSMLVFCLAIVLAFGYGLSVASTHPTVQSLQSSPTILALGLLMFLSPILSLVGSVLGFVAIFQKNSKKLFIILGLVFNLLTFLAFCVLLATGLAGQAGNFGL
jgi:hypothetical protein